MREFFKVDGGNKVIEGPLQVDGYDPSELLAKGFIESTSFSQRPQYGYTYNAGAKTFTAPIAASSSIDETLRQTLAAKSTTIWTQQDRDNALQLHLKSLKF